MKIESYSQIELVQNQERLQKKLLESKQTLKSIRDVADLRPLSPEIDTSGLGKKVDKYI